VNADQLFRAGKLREAVAAVVEDVRSRPSDLGRRLLLSELLCFTGELERADSHLDAIAHADPGRLPMMVGLRQLIRAEQARRDFHQAGNVPQFLTPPEGAERLLLEASVHRRAGDAKAESALLERVEAERAHPGGECNGEVFTDFRDLDDRMSCILEVYTSSGRYYWIPTAQIESMEFRDPAEPSDLLWRRVVMSVKGGPDGEVFIPVLYPGSELEEDDAIRLGRSTDWRTGEGGEVRGLGQRMFLVGENAVPILELKTVTFTASEPS
jgi:type VI secretion system protein ImpE